MKYLPIWAVWWYGLDSALLNGVSNPKPGLFLVWLCMGAVLSVHEIRRRKMARESKNWKNIDGTSYQTPDGRHGAWQMHQRSRRTRLVETTIHSDGRASDKTVKNPRRGTRKGYDVIVEFSPGATEGALRNCLVLANGANTRLGEVHDDMRIKGYVLVDISLSFSQC